MSLHGVPRLPPPASLYSAASCRPSCNHGPLLKRRAFSSPAVIPGNIGILMTSSLLAERGGQCLVSSDELSSLPKTQPQEMPAPGAPLSPGTNQWEEGDSEPQGISCHHARWRAVPGSGAGGQEWWPPRAGMSPGRRRKWLY